MTNTIYVCIKITDNTDNFNDEIVEVKAFKNKAKAERYKKENTWLETGNNGPDDYQYSCWVKMYPTTIEDA